MTRTENLKKTAAKAIYDLIYDGYQADDHKTFTDILIILDPDGVYAP